MFDLICKEHNCTIIVYGKTFSSDNSDENNENNENDLKDDFFSIINVFVASHNGKRAAFLKKERKRLKNNLSNN